MNRREILFDLTVEQTGMRQLFPGALMVEAWCSDLKVQTKWEQRGFMAILPLHVTGLVTSEDDVPIGKTVTDSSLAYGVAITNIQRDIQAGQLPPSAAPEALGYMLNGESETSRLSSYMPGQSQA